MEGKCILYLGNMEPKKNLPALIKAFRVLRSGGVRARLIVAGRQGWKNAELFDEVRRSGVGEEVRFIGFVPPVDQAALYGAADVFVHISAVEKAGMRSLAEGQKISYEIVTERGKQAAGNLQPA